MSNFKAIPHRIMSALKSIRPTHYVALLCAVLLMSMSVAIYNGMSFTVFLDDNFIGHVKSTDEITEIVKMAEQRAAEITGDSHVLSPDIRYETSLFGGDKVDKDALLDNLIDSVSDIEMLHVLRIDGKVMGAVYDGDELERELNSLLMQYAPIDGSLRVSFDKDVSISYEYASTTLLHTAKNLVHLISAEHTVNMFAVSFDKTSEMYLTLSSGTNDSKIYFTDSQMTSSSLSVTSVEKISYEEEIPFDTLYVTDSSMYNDVTTVISSGANGINTITADVTYVNGKEVSRTVLSEEVTVAPTARVIATGTQDRPAGVAKGSFIIPYNGKITSEFGYRKLRGVTNFHTGIDFAGPYGSLIKASDGGKVIYAGWRGNYGRLVMIDHGNGYISYYAHCSKLLVEEGDLVSQGDYVGKIGSTGNSTGNHVHFEVRLNGKYVDPATLLDLE